MTKKSSTLLYGVAEHLPVWMTVILGIQHTFVLTVALVFPVIILQSVGGIPI